MREPTRGQGGLRSPIETAIWFIESHFARDITLDELAGVCGLRASRCPASSPTQRA